LFGNPKTLSQILGTFASSKVVEVALTKRRARRKVFVELDNFFSSKLRILKKGPFPTLRDAGDIVKTRKSSWVVCEQPWKT